MHATSESLEPPSEIADPGQTETLTNGTPAPLVRVWLVDDNVKFRALVADLLGRREGIECARQFSSPDALLSALASKAGPDVILLDIQLGHQNGLDAVRPIKSLTRSTRVLMFTTCYDPEFRQRAFDEGASDYLLKSEPLEKLVERIREFEPMEVAKRLPVQRSARLIAEPVPIKVVKSVAAYAPLRPLRKTLEILRSLWN